MEDAAVRVNGNSLSSTERLSGFFDNLICEKG